jgi:hypothetical protein
MPGTEIEPLAVILGMVTAAGDPIRCTFYASQFFCTLASALGGSGRLFRQTYWKGIQEQRQKQKTAMHVGGRRFNIAGRGERIRTSDLSVPNRAHYQAVLRPEAFLDHQERRIL